MGRSMAFETWGFVLGWPLSRICDRGECLTKWKLISCLLRREPVWPRFPALRIQCSYSMRSFQGLLWHLLLTPALIVIPCEASIKPYLTEWSSEPLVCNYLLLALYRKIGILTTQNNPNPRDQSLGPQLHPSWASDLGWKLLGSNQKHLTSFPKIRRLF